MAKIPSTILDTGRAPQQERFALWRDALSPTHEATLPDTADPSTFSAYARGWNLGTSLVIETRATAQLLARAPQTIRADQIDHYIIRLQRHGSWNGEAGERTTEAGVGSVMVLDMARPTVALGTSIDNINV